MREDYGERSSYFNATTGTSGYMTAHGPRGGNYHPDRCVCQGGNVRENTARVGRGGDTIPHKHYDRPPYACARCECQAYEPHDVAKANALKRQARSIVEDASRGAAA